MLQICKNQRNQGEGKLFFLSTVHRQHVCFPPDLSFSYYLCYASNCFLICPLSEASNNSKKNEVKLSERHNGQNTTKIKQEVTQQKWTLTGTQGRQDKLELKELNVNYKSNLKQKQEYRQ